jgi:hypothetical protein
MIRNPLSLLIGAIQIGAAAWALLHGQSIMALFFVNAAIGSVLVALLS